MRGLAILSSRFGNFSPHANLGYLYRGGAFETDAATVDTAMLLLREAAGEATFAADAIANERGVVLSEERVRATFCGT